MYDRMFINLLSNSRDTPPADISRKKKFQFYQHIGSSKYFFTVNDSCGIFNTTHVRHYQIVD